MFPAPESMPVSQGSSLQHCPGYALTYLWSWWTVGLHGAQTLWTVEPADALIFAMIWSGNTHEPTLDGFCVSFVVMPIEYVMLCP
jgi:hypothetical protein